MPNLKIYHNLCCQKITKTKLTNRNYTIAKKKKEEVQEIIVKALGKAPDKLFKNFNSSDYKDFFLGLIFLKFKSNS